jgi:drug/metabolite transporter (DMT)-like permease
MTERERGEGATRGILMAIIATISYALGDAISKYLVRDYPVLMVAWARYAIPCALLLAIFLPRRGARMLRTGYPAVQLARGVLLTTGSILVLLAYRVMPMAEAQSIAFIHPLLLMLLAVLFLGEKATAVGWVAVFLGFSGVLVIVRPGGGLFTPAALLPLCLALTYSSYQMFTRVIATKESSVNSLFYILAIGTLSLGAGLPFLWVTPIGNSVLLFALLGLVSGIGHFSNIKALEYAPASMLAPFAYVQLLWVTILGAWIFGDFPDAITLCGMLIVIAGGLIAVAFRRKPSVAGGAAQ